MQTELVDAVADEAMRTGMQRRMAEIGIPAVAVARAIAFAIDMPEDVEIGDLTIRPTVQN